MDDQAQSRREATEPAAGDMRSPYVRPALKVYGDIAALTQKVGFRGMTSDGGMGAKSKTS